MPKISLNGALLSHRKMRGRAAFAHAGFALAIIFPLGTSPLAAGRDHFIPSFWDPHHSVEKPDLTTLRSLRFLTEDDYPPFHFALPDGTLAGFDIDLARAICEELKITCTIQMRRFDTLIASLDSKEGDAMLGSIRIDAKSRATLDFTLPYILTPARFVVPTTTGLTEAIPETLVGRRVGVVEGSAHQAYLSSFFPETTLKPYNSPAALRDGLAKREIDALFGDGLSLALWLQTPDAEACCRFIGGPYIDGRFFGEGIAIAVQKGNHQVRQALDYALAMLAAKGTYTELYLKYFPLGAF
jgi:polar amino acid transport system substrate-binding protein